MSRTLRVRTPIDGSVYVERALLPWEELERVVVRAREAQVHWARTPLGERTALLGRAIAAFVDRRDEIAAEITAQIGASCRWRRTTRPWRS